MQYAEELVAKTPRCGVVYLEYTLNKSVIQRLDPSIRKRLCDYLDARKEATLHHLEIHAISILSL